MYIIIYVDMYTYESSVYIYIYIHNNAKTYS